MFKVAGSARVRPRCRRTASRSRGRCLRRRSLPTSLKRSCPTMTVDRSPSPQESCFETSLSQHPIPAPSGRSTGWRTCPLMAVTCSGCVHLNSAASNTHARVESAKNQRAKDCPVWVIALEHTGLTRPLRVQVPRSHPGSSDKGGYGGRGAVNPRMGALFICNPARHIHADRRQRPISSVRPLPRSVHPFPAFSLVAVACRILESPVCHFVLLSQGSMIARTGS